jgi:hypothetical protein
MTNDLRFGRELSGTGRATCRIADSSSQWQDVVGYRTDALADLLHRVAGLHGTVAVHASPSTSNRPK